MKVYEVSKVASGLSTDRALRKLHQQLQSIRFHNELYTKLHWRDYRQFTPIPYPLAYVLTVLLFAVMAVILSCEMPTRMP